MVRFVVVVLGCVLAAGTPTASGHTLDRGAVFELADEFEESDWDTDPEIASCKRIDRHVVECVKSDGLGGCDAICDAPTHTFRYRLRGRRLLIERSSDHDGGRRASYKPLQVADTVGIGRGRDRVDVRIGFATRDGGWYRTGVSGGRREEVTGTCRDGRRREDRRSLRLFGPGQLRTRAGGGFAARRRYRRGSYSATHRVGGRLIGNVLQAWYSVEFGGPQIGSRCTTGRRHFTGPVLTRVRDLPRFIR